VTTVLNSPIRDMIDLGVNLAGDGETVRAADRG
jgi:hypothetical protein